LSEDEVLKTLVGLGLTRIDSQIYICLAKKGPQKGNDLSRIAKVQKQQLYRSLKGLQSKGIVYASLEHPARFSAVPFDRVVDLSIKAKMTEAKLIQEKKEEILKSWQSLNVGETTDSAEKFSVIEGRRYSYSKISQMIKETKSHLSSVSTVTGLLRAEQFGLFDEVFTHPLKQTIEFRFLTDISNQNLNTVKDLLKKMPKNLSNIKGRNSDTEFNLSPRMVIRDEEEIFLFISPMIDESATGQDEVGLWTNCKTIVQSFLSMFEDLWRNSTDFAREPEIQVPKFSQKTNLISNIETAIQKYDETVRSANEEIIIVTSSEGLVEFWKNIPELRKLAKKGVSIKIMAPIAKNNLDAVKKLSLFCQVRHVPMNCREATIIDGKHLFMLDASISNPDKIFQIPLSYSYDSEQIDRMRTTLDKIWKNASKPSNNTIESIVGPYGFVRVSPIFDDSIRARGVISVSKKQEQITEKDVLNKIINAEKFPIKNTAKDVNRMYASAAWAKVHPPAQFNLPELMFHVDHIEKQSSFGEGDALEIYLWSKTPDGRGFVAMGGIGDNPRGVAFRKVAIGEGAADNYNLVKKNEIQVRVYGNTLFAGWAVPICLSTKYFLPPGCIIIEGYGDVKTKAFSAILSSGLKYEAEQNWFDAYVTFMHPKSKYSGAGTDGLFVRDLVATMTPLQSRFKVNPTKKGP
jgi:sugar-specific transcriptional regulator TrmB